MKESKVKTRKEVKYKFRLNIQTKTMQNSRRILKINHTYPEYLCSKKPLKAFHSDNANFHWIMVTKLMTRPGSLLKKKQFLINLRKAYINLVTRKGFY